MKQKQLHHSLNFLFKLFYFGERKYALKLPITEIYTCATCSTLSSLLYWIIEAVVKITGRHMIQIKGIFFLHYFLRSIFGKLSIMVKIKCVFFVLILNEQCNFVKCI